MRNALDAGRRHRLLCERLEPRYLLSADLLPLSADHPDALDLTLDYDATTQVLELIDNDVLDEQGHPAVLAAIEAPAADQTLTIAYDPSYGDNGALIIGTEQSSEGRRVEIVTGDGDDRVRLVNLDFDGLSFSVDTGAGEDVLVVETLGPTDLLGHEHTGPQHGRISVEGSPTTHEYAGVELLALSDDSDTYTLTPTRDANLTLAQNTDGQLVAVVQHAFDATTSLDELDGSDGFHMDAVGGGFGQAVASAGDFNHDGFEDVIVGAPGDDAAYLIYGTDQGFDATLDPAALDGSNGLLLTGPSGQNFGFAVGGAGDVNGDGIDDVIVGAPGPLGSFTAGASYVVFGTDRGGTARLDVATLDGGNGFALTGAQPGEASGYSVAVAGDVNGDGFADLVIGAPESDMAGMDAGAVYLVFGTDQGFDASVSLTTLNGKNGLVLTGGAAGDAAGTAVAGGGDLNGDNVADVVIGAPGADPNGEDSGAAYVFFGAVDFDVASGLSGMFFDTGPVTSLSAARDAIAGTLPTATFLAYAIDYPNGDDFDTVPASTGFEDFVGLNAEAIDGGEGATVDGSVFLFDGYLHVPEAGTYTFEVGSAEGFSLAIDGETVIEHDGTRAFDQSTGSHTFAEPGFHAISLLYFTDSDPSGIEVKSDLVTADGSLELIPREFLYTNPPSAAWDLSALDGFTGFILEGEAAGDGLGSAVGTAGDVNVDGAADLIVGAPGHDGAGADSGRAYVVFGETLTTVFESFPATLQAGSLADGSGLILDGTAAGARTGSAVGGGDLNADGESDAIVGAPGSGVGGVIQVLFGDAGLGVDDGLNEAIDLAKLNGVVGFSASTGQAGAGLGSALAVADLNGDGEVDLLAGEPATGGASVLFGRSVGGKTTTTTYELPASAFIVDGAEAGARITVGVPANPEPLLGDDGEYSEDVNTAGADYVLRGFRIMVDPGITLSTRHIAAGADPGTAESIGNSGKIVMADAIGVDIGTGAAIYAHVEEGSSFDPGDVEIRAENQIPFIPVGGFVQELAQEGKYRATVSIGDGVAIRGGNVTIEANAGTSSGRAFSSMGTAAGGVANDILSVLKAKYGDLLNIPVSVLVSTVSADIEIGASDTGNGVSIEASDDVRVEASAVATARGNALSWGQLPETTVRGNPFAFAVAFWWAESTGTVTLHSNVEVSSAAGDIDIGAEANTAAGGKAKVAQNIDQGIERAAPAGRPANPNNIGLAVGVGVTRTTARVEVPNGASVRAEAGNVSITASGEDKVVTRAQTTSYEQGTAGAAINVLDTTSDIRALVDGEVHAGGGGTEVDPRAEFNPFLAVDSVNDTIDLGADHGYETGDEVEYSVGFGWAIDGLERGHSYFVITDESNPGRIQFAATRADALARTAIDLGDNPELTTTGGERIAFTQVDDELDLIDFGFDPGFEAGDGVVYRAATEKPIGGLTDGNTYYVVAVPGDAARWQLANDAAGTDLVDFDLSPYFLTSDGERITIDSVDEDSDLVNLAEAAAIQTGDALTFHSALGFRLLDGEENLIGDGTVLYAVVPPLADDDPQDVVTSIRLARTQEDAEGIRGGMVTPYPVTLALEVDIDLMLGAAHLLEPSTGQGITIKADLESEFTVQSQAGLGSGPANVFKRYTSPEFSSAATGWRDAVYHRLDDPRAGPAENSDNPLQANSSTALVGSIGIHVGSATVEAVVGSNAELTSGADITVTAEHAQVGDTVVESGASQKEQEGLKRDIGVAFSLSLFSNDVYAVVNSGASLDAGREIEVEASYERRFPAPIDNGEHFAEFLLDEFESAPTDFLNELNTFLLHPLFTTGWTYSNVSPKETDVAVSGAVQLAFYDNTVEAIVADGVELNQQAEFETDEQAVTVSADTTVYLVDGVGVFEFNFTPENIFKRLFNLGSQRPFIEMTEGRSQAWGVSFQWVDVTNRTVAALGVASPLDDRGDSTDPVTSAAPAEVHISSEEKLTVQSSETLWAFGFGNSGAKTESGTVSFAGTGMVFRHNPGASGETRAQIGAGTVVTGGSVKVSADDELIVVYENGAIVTGNNTAGIGVGVNYLEINRRLRAFIGDLNGQATGESSFMLDDGSTIDVSATSEGFVVSFALAYANRATEEEQPSDADNEVEAPDAKDNHAGASEQQQAVGDGANPGKSGFQLAGDASFIDLGADQVLAFIDDLGTFKADQISVAARSINDYVNLVGAFAVSQVGDDSSSNVGLAGSFAGLKLDSGSSDGVGRYDSDTLAYVRRATLAVGAAGLAVSADRRGLYFGAAAGGAGVPRGAGIEVAGSVTWTDLDYRTLAYLDGATVTLAGDSSIEARDRVATIGFAGDGVYKSSIGFGTSWAWNQVDRQVQATAFDSTITQSAGTLSLDAVIWDIAKSDDGTLLPSAYAVAVTLGIGDKDVTALELTGTVAVNHFNTDTAGPAVDASLRSSTYQQPDNGASEVTGLSLSAIDNTNLLALAGAVGGEASLTIGIAAAVNELDDQATAVVENSSVAVNQGDVTLEARINPEMNALAVGLELVDDEGIAFAGSGARNTARDLSADAHVSGAVNGTTGETDTSITGASSVGVHAELAYTDILAGAGQFGIQTGANFGGAIGAAVAINDLSSHIATAYVQDAELTASGGIDVSARTGMAPDGVILGLAVGGDGTSDFALGGSVVDQTVDSTTLASVNGDAAYLQAGGDVSVKAHEAELVIASGAGVISAQTASGGGAAIGTAVATNTVDSDVEASVETAPRDDGMPSIESTNGSVMVRADRDDALLVAVALGGTSATSAAVSASVATNTVTHTTAAHVTGDTWIRAEDSVSVTASETSPAIIAAAGNYTESNEGIAVGAAVPTNTIHRQLTAYVGDSDQDDFEAGADGSTLTATTGTATVSATRRDSLLLAIGVSGEGAEKFSLGGSVVENNVTESTVDAHVWGGELAGDQGVDIEASDRRARHAVAAGNVDMSFTFRSLGAGDDSGGGPVDSQEYVRKATENAEEDEVADRSAAEEEEEKAGEVEEELNKQDADAVKHGFADMNAWAADISKAIEDDTEPVEGTAPQAEAPEPDASAGAESDGGLEAGSGVSVGIALANNLSTSPTVTAFASDSTLSSDAGSIEIEAHQTALFVTVAGSGSLQDETLALDVTEATTDYRPATRAYIDAVGSENSTATAHGNVIVAADSVVHAVTIAGNVAFNKSGSSVAGTVATMAHRRASTEAWIDHADVTSSGNDDGGSVAIGDQGDKSTVDDFHGVSVTATSKQVFTTVAAGIELSSKSNIAASVSLNLIGDQAAGEEELITRAYVGAGATLNEDNADAGAAQSVNVFAFSDTTVHGGGGALGISTGNTWGGGAGADGGKIAKLTEAYLAAPTVNANNLVLVQAYSEETLASYEGSVQISDGSELAGALGVYVFDLTTNAYIAGGSEVVSQGSVLVAANNTTQATFFTGTIDVAGGGEGVGASIAVTTLTAHTRAYIDENATVKGLAQDGTDSISAATGDYEISYTDEVAADGTELAPPGGVPAATAGDGELGADDPVWTQVREATAEYSDIRGVAVTANASDVIKGFVGTAGDSKGAAVQGALFVPVTQRTTSARISGTVNATDELDAASADQDVVVAAGSDYHVLGVVVLLAGSQDVVVAPAVDWLSADLTTLAFIDDGASVGAGGDVLVVAAAFEHLTRVTVGASTSFGGDFAVEGSVTGLYLKAKTRAYVGEGATVRAVGHVVISASDDTVETGVAGGIAVGASEDSGAVGAGFVYTHVEKTTEASINRNAIVDAGGDADAVTVLDGGIADESFSTTTLQGVAVQARSSEKLTNFGIAGAGGFDVGVAGGVTYTHVDSDTSATIANGAQVNQTEGLSAVGAQSVNVSAANAVEVLDVGGGFAGALAAASGGISVGIVRNSTTASIASGANVSARRDIDVHAAAIKDVKSYTVSVAVGGAGVAGSVSVWALGDQFSPHYDTANTTGNDSLAIEGSGQDAPYDSVYQSNGDQPSYVDGQANRADAVSAMSGYGNPDGDPDQANLLALRDQSSATVQSNSDAQAGAASRAFGATDTADTEGVTEAVVAGTVEAGRDLGITSREWTGLRMVTGSGELPGIGVGASVGVTAVRGAALAHLDGSATVGGDVLVSAERRADYHGDAIIGQAGIAAAGAGVAVVVDRSVQAAYVGDGAEILRAGSLDVSARRSYAAFELLVVEAQVGLAGAAGASVASGRVLGATRAYIGDATIGDPDAVAAAVGDVRIEATSSAAPRARAYAGTGGLTVAGDGARADAYVTPTVEAFYASMGGPLAAGASPESLNRIGGDLTIAANSTAEPDAVALGIAVAGGVAVPVSLPTAIASPTVRAYVGPGSIARVIGNGSSNPATATGRLEISAVAADDPHASGSGAGGAVGLAVEVSVTAASIDTTLAAYIGDDSIASANTDVIVHAEHEYVGKATAWGLDLGVLSVGINNATLTIEPDVQAYIGAATVTAQGDVEIIAESGEPGELPDLTFDSGTSVDYATNVITFDHPHGLETGDSVVYHADDGSQIPGLEDGLSYDVIRVSGTQIKLGVLFTAEDVDAATGTIRFDRPHGLDSGSPVLYDNNGNPSVNGLVPGLAYFVNALHPGVAKLASTAEIAANTEFGIFDGRDDVDLEADEIRLPVAYLRTGEDLFLTGTVVFQDNQLVTNQASTRLQVGDAVIYVPPGSLEGLVIKPLDPYRAYFVARVATVNGQVQVALAETRADALAGHVIELSSNATGGRLIGVDGSSWQLTGAGVNSPAAWIDGGKVLEAVSFSSDPTKLGSSTEPWPFQTGDLVVWTRHDGDYGTGERFGLLPGVAYYANVTNGGLEIQFAESLADLASGHFVKLSLPTDVADNHALVSELNSFLSPVFPVQTGDAFTYHAPQPIPVAGEDIDRGTPEQPDLPYSLLVTVGDRLYTTVLDLVDLPAVPGEQRGLLGSWYGPGTVSNLSEALSVAQGSPPGAWVSSGVLYPGSGGNTAPSGTTIAGLLGPDADSLVGEAATRTIPNLVLVFEGFVRVDKAGTYEFEVRSDDGFQLTIDNQVVTSFAGTRSFASSTGNHSFNAPGFYPLQLVYFNAGGSGGVQLRSDLRGKDGNGNNLILDDTLLFLPQGLTYDGPATSSGTDTVSPLERGANYAVISGQGFPYAGILMPLDPRLNPNADALASVHQFRVPGFDPIDGLEDGRTYYMIVDETRPGVVRLADSRADARDRIAIDLGAAPSLAVPVEGVRTTDELGSDAIAVTGAAGDASLWRVAAAGDFNGDTLSDVLITASGTKHLVFGSGAAMVDLTIPDATRQIELDIPGTVLAGVGDINADGIEDIAIGDPGADTISVVLGSSMGFPATVSSADFVIIGAGAGSRLGAAIAGADVNGDGVDDLILGAPGTDRTYVVFGAADLGITGTVDLGVFAGGGNGLQGAFYDTDKLPTLDEAVLAAGLQTPDWLFTSTQLDYPADADYVFDTQGLAALLGNDAPAGTPDTDLTGSVFTYRGYLDVPQAGTYTFVVNADDGFRLSIGGQVVTEKIIRGAFSVFPGTAVVTFDRAGLVPIELVHWEYGDATGVRLESDIGGSMGLIPTDLLYTTGGFVIEGAVAGSEFGSEVADARDLNADGVEDIVIAAPAAAGGAGEVYALYGASHARGTSFDLGSLSARTGGLIRGTTGSAAGTSLAGLGDVNGDGYGDLAIGAPLGSAPDKSYVVFGRERFDAAVDLGALDGGAGFGISGGGASSLVSAAGDMNADGLADLAVAQPQTASGQVTVVYGSPTLGEDGSISLSTVADGLDGFTVVGTTPDGLLGASLAGAGDVDGDGVSDLLMAQRGGAIVVRGAPARAAFESVHANANTIEFAGAGALATGDALYYTGAPGVHVGGLEANTVYYAIATGSGDTLQLARTATDAAAGRFIELDLSPRLEIAELGDSFTIRPGSVHDTLTFDQMPAIQNGQAVVYREAWGTRLVGLRDGETYYAIVSPSLPARTIRLSDSAVGALNSDGSTNYLLFHVGAHEVSGTHYLGLEGIGITPPGSDLALGTMTDADDLDGVDGLSLDGAVASGAAGTAVTGVGDVDGDGFDDALVIGSEGSYLVFGFDEIDVARLDLGALGERGVEITLAGQTSGLVGDLNGDSFADIVIGNTVAGNGAGEVSIVFGTAAGFSAGIGTADLTISGLQAGDLLGSSIAGADINNDGMADLVIGAPGAGSGRGAVYVIFGGTDFGASAIDLAELDGSSGFAIAGDLAGGEAGRVVSSAGDVNSDLIEDLVFGAPGIDRAYVLFGSSGSFAATLSTADLAGRSGIVLAGGTGTRTGAAVGSAGDVDGDGADDLLIGAPLADPTDRVDAGQSYLVFGSGRSFPSLVDLTALDGSTGVILNGVDAGDSSGAAVSGVGDLNGDDLGDFMVGAPLAAANGLPSAGSAYLVFGSSDLRGTASIELGLLGQRGATFNGSHAGDTLGTALASLGDFNGDQVADLILGAPNVTVDGRASAGRAYVVFGADPNARHYLVHDLAAPPKTGAQRLEQSRDVAPSGLTGTPKVTAWGMGGHLIGGDGASATATITPIVRAFIGAAAGFDTASGAQVTAVGGDVYIEAFSATDVDATTTGYDISLLAGGGSAHTTVTLQDVMTEAYVGRDAVVQAENGKFTLLASASDTLTGTASAVSGGTLDIFAANADVTAKRRVQATIGAATVTAADIEIDALKSTNASANSTADAGGRVVVPSSRAILTVGDSATPTIKVLVSGGARLDATGGTVKLRAANFSEGASARDHLSATTHSRSFGYLTGQNSTARITLNEYAQNHTVDNGSVEAARYNVAAELDWAQLDVDATGRTRSFIGVPSVHATLEGTVQGGNFLSGATSYSRRIGHDVQNDPDIVTVHTLQNYSVFWARIPAKHPNQVNTLSIDPVPPQPPPSDDAVESTDPPTPPPPGPVNSVPESLTLEPSSLEVGGIRVGDELRIGGTFYDADLDDVHQASVDWGDGTVEILTLVQAAGGGLYHGGHVYAQGGIYEVQVTVTDDSGDSLTDSLIVPVTGMRVHEGVLQIVGSPGHDEVYLDRVGNDLVVMANLDDALVDQGVRVEFGRHALNEISSVVVVLGRGEDYAEVISGGVTLPVSIDGGAGFDEFVSVRPVVLDGEGGFRVRGTEISGTNFESIKGPVPAMATVFEPSSLTLQAASEFTAVASDSTGSEAVSAQGQQPGEAAATQTDADVGSRLEVESDREVDASPDGSEEGVAAPSATVSAEAAFGEERVRIDRSREQRVLVAADRSMAPAARNDGELRSSKSTLAADTRPYERSSLGGIHRVEGTALVRTDLFDTGPAAAASIILRAAPSDPWIRGASTTQDHAPSAATRQDMAEEDLWFDEDDGRLKPVSRAHTIETPPLIDRETGWALYGFDRKPIEPGVYLFE